MKELSTISASRVIPLPRVFRGNGMRIISVTGGKGGVGKSSISVNLALALNRLGGRILLVDGDMGLANADQLLGVHAPSTLLDVVNQRVSLEDAVLETPHGISLLPACSGRREMSEIDAGTRTTLMDSIKGLDRDFDFVVIDTAAGIGDTAVSLAASGNQILAVATPDPTSVRDCFSVMKILTSDFGCRRISLVPNMVKSPSEGLALFKRISGVTNRFLPLSLGLGGTIVRDPNLSRAVLDRNPLMAGFPSSPASKQIMKLAAYVITCDREMLDFESDPKGESQ